MVSTNWTKASDTNTADYTKASSVSTNFAKPKDGKILLSNTTVLLSDTDINLLGQDTSGDPDTFHNPPNWSTA